MEKQIEEAIKLLKANGYSVTKKPEPVKLLPCVCGRKRLSLWYMMGSGNEFYKCPNCDFAGESAKTTREAKILWNEAVEREKECTQNT